MPAGSRGILMCILCRGRERYLTRRGRDELFHGAEILVDAEEPRSENLQTFGAAHDRSGAATDDAYPLAVGQHFSGQGLQ
jgi:hypothetical protein